MRCVSKLQKLELEYVLQLSEVEVLDVRKII